MNIQQAKEQVKNALVAYRTRDEYGRLVIPQQRQRPMFLVGAPGIGKTAIMEQIAQELGIPLVSYSMTHHTRQSALGLPFICDKVYNGENFRVSEYTMSEIIAAVYDKMESSGVTEGILFLDEINCVSETLAPAMLQFLQYKVFGQHKVPEGWIVVTAGNPPEYNNSVREFDMVTWDRLKRVDVEPDLEAWRRWALNNGVHPAVNSYLEIRKGDFYQVESTVDGKSFVTPRGWVDLSDMIRLYEQHDFKVDEVLVGQYLQNQKIARQFASYYDLWKKYESDYAVEDILNGKASDAIKRRATAAKFDERLSLVSLLLEGLLSHLRPVMYRRTLLENVHKELKELRKLSAARSASMPVLMERTAKAVGDKLKKQKAGGMLSRDDERVAYDTIAFMNYCIENLIADKTEKKDIADAYAIIKAHFEKQIAELKKQAKEVGKKLENLIKFVGAVFSEEAEMLILITELTATSDTARFIAYYGSEGYHKVAMKLHFYERETDIKREIDQLTVNDL